MESPIKVSYQHTSNAYHANQLLSVISQYPLIACDFEVAVKFTQAELTQFQEELATNPTKRRTIELNANLGATALSHPSYCTLTHCSIAISESEGFVFILDNPKITSRVLNFLTTTTQKQVWHGASFDFRHIYHQTGKFPIDYEDTQIFAKTILNHVEINKALTGLKELAGHWYGAWGISSDNFTTESYYDPKMLLYAATDACACFKLWHSINRHVEDYAVSDV